MTVGEYIDRNRSNACDCNDRGHYIGAKPTQSAPIQSPHQCAYHETRRAWCSTHDSRWWPYEDHCRAAADDGREANA